MSPYGLICCWEAANNNICYIFEDSPRNWAKKHQKNATFDWRRHTVWSAFISRGDWIVISVVSNQMWLPCVSKNGVHQILSTFMELFLKLRRALPDVNGTTHCRQTYLFWWNWDTFRISPFKTQWQNGIVRGCMIFPILLRQRVGNELPQNRYPGQKLEVQEWHHVFNNRWL